MARRAALALLCAALLGGLVRTEDGGDFNLFDALDEGKKVTVAPKKPSTGHDFSLEDALGGGGDPDPVPPKQREPKPNPRPNHPGSSGGFSDADLVDAAGGEGNRDGRGGGSPRKDGDSQDEQPQGVIPGIIGAVVVAVAGAISSFIAYQKKKWCFKDHAEHGEVDLQNRQTSSAEPPVRQTLLEK